MGFIMADEIVADRADAFLAAILRGERPAWPKAGFGEAPAALLERIRVHGMAALLAERVEALADWPADLRDGLLEEARLQAFWEETHRAMLAKLYALLEAKGVTALVMKGTALAYSLYEEPSARRRGDSDLLVRESDLDASRAALREQGFTKRHDPQGLFFQETWLLDTCIGIVHSVDLHWQANDSPLLQRVLVLEEYFAGRIPLPRLAPQAFAPDPVLTFLQCSLNQAWHRAHGYLIEDECVMADVRLVWAWDNHLLAQSFDTVQWDRLAGLAADRGIAAFVLAALDLAHDHLRSFIPETVRERLASAPQDTKPVRRLLEKNHLGSVRRDMSAIEGLAPKMRFLLGHAVPPSEHLRLKYPNSSHWPVPLLHLRRLAAVAMRWREVLPRR